jgi:RimJ/RimL family protein N-acetyltransferase
VQHLAGDRRVADTTLNVPHPYNDGMAEAWIDGHAFGAAAGRQFDFAITLAGTRTPGREQDVTDTGHLIGTVSLTMTGDRGNERAELGYWIGVPYWNKAFATEASHAVLRFGFERRKLHRILARHFTINPASGRVMQKLGMTPEGVLREHQRKGDAFLDVAVYGILAGEWIERQRTHKLRREPALQPA